MPFFDDEDAPGIIHVQCGACGASFATDEADPAETCTRCIYAEERAHEPEETDR